MTKNKGSTRVAMALTPRRLLAIVCKYYGIGDTMELASSAKLGLSSCWRHSIAHLDVEDAELATVVHKLTTTTCTGNSSPP